MGFPMWVATRPPATRTGSMQHSHESGRCNGSSRPDKPRIFFQLTHSSTITSIPAAIALPPVPTEQSGPTNLESGTRRRVPNAPHNVCAERSLLELEVDPIGWTGIGLS
jgi:hypothetical protein